MAISHMVNHTETAIMGQETARETAIPAGIAGLGLMNASTCDAIPTFSERSDAVKRPPGRTMSSLVAVRGEGLAAKRAAGLDRFVANRMYPA